VKEYLLIDCCTHGILELSLNESSERGLTKFRGKFQEADAVNKNKRMYTYDVLNENVKKLQECIKSRGLVGELDHPEDSIIHFEKASHVITKVWWEGQVLMGEGEILNTPHGKILKALINDGVRVGVSSRGVGNGKVNENGILVIDESYKLITFDVVADPSTFAAFQQKVTSTTKESQEYAPLKVEKSQKKNETQSIHKVNKDALIACLGGIVREKTNNIKMRLG
jgi:hypothetical protein